MYITTVNDWVMQEIIAAKNEKIALKPSLLQQIVDEVDTLTTRDQQDLLRQIRLHKLGTDFKLLDEKLQANEIKLTEEAIAELISEDRKRRYEEKIRS
jgi:hypothetical protein